MTDTSAAPWEWEAIATGMREQRDKALAERDALKDQLAKAIQERDEMKRRRDAWREKAEGYDEVRRALREKVGTPWPPNLSRALWAGLAADQKKRADDLEAELNKAVNALVKCRDEIDQYIRQEYPDNHPVQERRRQRDLSANPARAYLASVSIYDG